MDVVKLADEHPFLFYGSAVALGLIFVSLVIGLSGCVDVSSITNSSGVESHGGTGGQGGKGGWVIVETPTPTPEPSPSPTPEVQ